MLEKINYTEKDKETLTKMLEMMLEEGANEHILTTQDVDWYITNISPYSVCPGDNKIKLRRYRIKIDMYEDLY